MSLKRFTTYASSLLLAILVAVLIITPAIPVRASVTDFNGPSLPADWFATAWFSGGAATSTNGTLAVDGALTGTVALYGPGLSLEFVATFTGAPWQHIGFGLDYNAAPWIIFSTFRGEGELYARTNSEAGQVIDTAIPGAWFGTPHRYRIDWQPTQVVFSIDGTVVATHAVPVAANLRPLVSDFNVGDGTLAVHSIEMFTSVSRVDFASGANLPEDWFATAWFPDGAATSTNGTLAVDGALTGTVALYEPGLSLEFVATFTGAPWQHIGFGLDYNAAPWIIFSTFQGGQLYARTNSESGQAIDTIIPGAWFGTPHRYRIDWYPPMITFSIDGTVVATHAVPVAANLRPLVSDFNVGDGTLTVDWLEMLVPIVNLDFSDTSLPPGWSSGAWNNDGQRMLPMGYSWSMVPWPARWRCMSPA